MADVENSKLLNDIEGIHHLENALVVLVKTDWNSAIVNELEAGCLRVFKQHGIQCKTITVPGAVEIPFAINQCAAHNRSVSAFVALGCVIRGGTPHFEYVCQSLTAGINRLNLTLSVPVIFGVLTVDNQQQAEERIGGAHGHKGEEAAVTAIKMMVLNSRLLQGQL